LLSSTTEPNNKIDDNINTNNNKENDKLHIDKQQINYKHISTKVT